MRTKLEVKQTFRVSAWPLFTAGWVAVACAQPRPVPTAALEAVAPGTPAAMAQIELSGIERIFTLGDSEVHALRAVSLSIEPGE